MMMVIAVVPEATRTTIRWQAKEVWQISLVLDYDRGVDRGPRQVVYTKQVLPGGHLIANRKCLPNLV